MKKLLTVFLVLLPLAAGLFFYKGGHHAIFLAGAMEQWLDADEAAQTIQLQLQRPGFAANGDTIMPRVEQLSISADAFWTEYNDAPLFGLTAQGVSAYTDGRNLYTDTGKAYSLPELSGLRKTARELALGLLLHGRVTKSGDSYRVAMDTEELELHAAFTADRTLRSAAVTAVLPDETVFRLSMKTKDSAPHSIPQPVLDAMVRSKMEKPIPLTEPLNILLPALGNLLPLEGRLSLSVECGILNISDTAVLRMDSAGAELERNGTITALSIPDVFSSTDPAALALLLLRNGSFTMEGSAASIQLDLPPEATEQLCTALLPRLSELSISYGNCRSTLTFRDSALTCVTLCANGEVPFLLGTIPVSLRGELTIP